MNLVHLVPYETYKNKMARERFKQVEAIAETPNMYVHTTGPGWPDWNDKASPLQNMQDYHEARRQNPAERVDAILSYQVTGLQGCPIPVTIVLQEAYNHPKTVRLIEDTDPRLVVFTYANEMPQYADWLERSGRTWMTIGHCADATIFRDYKLTKDIDILIVGNMNESIYPFRRRLARLAWREIRKRGYNVVWLPHPGYTLPPKAGLVGEEYAKMINRSRLVITCTSRFKYALTKLVEIPLCMALPVSDIPFEREKFFKQTMLNVEPWMTDKEIQFLIEDVLDTDDKWAAMVAKARDKIEAYLTMKFWAERYVYWIRRVILGEDPHPPMPQVPEEDM